MKRITAIGIIILFLGIVLWGFSGYQQQPKTMPLIPMMQQLLTDMQTVDQGIYTEDFELIAKGAGDIANHPKMTDEDKKIIKQTVGQEIKKFVSFDMVVHHHADSMRMAAMQKKMQKVLNHYRVVQQGCVDCHSNYRTEVSNARKAEK